MAKQLVRFALLILLVSISCNMPVVAETPGPVASPRAVSQLIVAADPGSTATPTPFQPVGATITPTPTDAPTATATVEPTATEEIIVPTPVPVMQQAAPGVTNFLILGNDLRPGGGFRTDIMMLVSVNGDTGTASVVSFPRDLYLNIPGWMTQRINTAFAHGGFPLLASTFEYNFGVRPKFYIMTNFDGFISIINSMGGIQVNVGQFISDSCDLPQSRGGRCTLYPGEVPMDGAMALWYVRSRHTSSDFDRARRSQEVLYGLFNRFMSADAVSRLPDLYNDYRSSVDTNMGLEDMAGLLPVAPMLVSDPGRIHRYAVGPGQVYDYITPDGAMVLLPNYAAINQMISQAISGQ